MRFAQASSPAPSRATPRATQWFRSRSGLGWLLALSLATVACESRGPRDDSTARQDDSGEASSPEEPRPDPDRSITPGSAGADGTLRVVFLGTSLTAGYGLEDPLVEGWPGRVGALAERAGLPVEVLNAGVSGETSAGGLRRIDWILREPLDMLVVELGANDALRGQDPGALQVNLGEILRRARDAYPEARLVLARMEAPPNLGADYGRAFRAVYDRVAEEHGATLLPFLLDGVAGVPELNQADGIHPTAEGHRAMAGLAWETIGPLLREMARPLPP